MLHGNVITVKDGYKTGWFYLNNFRGLCYINQYAHLAWQMRAVNVARTCV